MRRMSQSDNVLPLGAHMSSSEEQILDCQPGVARLRIHGLLGMALALLLVCQAASADLLVEQWETGGTGGLALADATMAGGPPAVSEVWPIIDFTDDPFGFPGDFPGSSPWPLATLLGQSGTGAPANSDFVARVSGYILISEADTYNFRTFNDDGARLRVDGIDVIVDDSYHPEVRFFGSIFLAPGAYPVELVFFEAYGEASLEFAVAKGSGPYVLVGGEGGPITVPPDASYFAKTIISGPDELDPTPESITFEVLNTTCGVQAAFDFELNGTSLGSAASDPTFGCICAAPTDTIVFSDAGLIASVWDPVATNDLRFVKSGGSNAIAWVRATLQSGAQSKSVCVFDVSGGNCDVTDLCAAGFTFADVDATAGADPTDGEIDLVVEVGQFESTQYDFSIEYFNPDGVPVLIEDTVAAEWMVELLDDDDGNAVAASANGKDNDKSATKIGWMPDPSILSDIIVWAETRGPKNNGKFAPTSCGALMLNDGAEAYELDPATGEPLLDSDGHRLPPILASNNLCLAAVADVNGDSFITRDGSGDEDGDTLTDYEEACEIGTDPCSPDTDGDGVSDDLDACPLEGDAGLGVDADGCPL